MGDAPLTRDRSKFRAWNDPGSAVHRYALHRVREKHQDLDFEGQVDLARGPLLPPQYIPANCGGASARIPIACWRK
jgi:hypothetical protein